MIIHLQSAVDNASAQVGDTAYYVDTQDAGQGYSQQVGNNVQSIGTITEIGASYIRVADNTDIPTSAFIMFSKNNNVNTTSLKGYFAEIKLQNSTTEPAELFAIGAESTESSK